MAKGSSPGVTQSVGADRLKVALTVLAQHADERAQTFISAQTLGEYLIPDSTPKGQRNAGHLAIAGLIHLGIVEELPSAGNHPRVLQLMWPNRMADHYQEPPSAITSAITSAINDMPSSRANVLKYVSNKEALTSLVTYVGEHRTENTSEAETPESELSIRGRFALAEKREEERRLQAQAEADRAQEQDRKERSDNARRLALWLAQVAEKKRHATVEEASTYFRSEPIQAELQVVATGALLSQLQRKAENMEQILASIYDRFSPALLQEARR